MPRRDALVSYPLNEKIFMISNIWRIHSQQWEFSFCRSQVGDSNGPKLSYSPPSGWGAGIAGQVTAPGYGGSAVLGQPGPRNRALMKVERVMPNKGLTCSTRANFS
jgi:hypothetical protein